MSTDGREVANFILDFCELRGRKISNLSLQKVIYFCHVWCLIELHRPLVKQTFEAWEYGPVLPYLYRDFRDFNDQPITGRASGLNVHTGERYVVGYEFEPEMHELLEAVVNFYSQLGPFDLVKMSHVPDGPWDRVWNHAGKINPGMRIENSDIARYYTTISAPFSAGYGTYQ